MMTWAIRLALVGWLAFAPFPAGGQAQDADGFGCSDDDAASERPYSSLRLTSEFSFRQLAAGDPAPGGTPTLELGPFDDELYCFRTIEVFGSDLVPMLPRGGWRLHEIELTIHLAGPAHDSWWVLVRVDGKPLTARIEDSDAPALSGVQWALPTAREPIFEASIDSAFGGLGQRSRETEHLLVDLRSATPRVMAEYVCGESDYAGMPCTWGEHLPEKGGFSCEWEGSMGDYRCTSSTTYSLPWIDYSRESCFLLTARTHLDCESAPRPPARRLTTALVEAMGNPRAMGRSVAIADVGIATVLAVVPAKHGAGGGVVLGTPSDELTFNPSLFFADLGADGTPRLRKLDLKFVGAATHPGGAKRRPGSSEWHAQPTNADPIRLVSNALFADHGRLRLYRIVVEQGSARALVLIGVEGAAEELRGGAIVLATKATYRGRCGDPLYPSTAVVLRSEPGDLPVRLDVEPAFQAGGIQGPSQDGCREVVELDWDHASGFVIEKKDENCHMAPNVRLVEIGDDGFLSYSTLISHW